MPKITVHGGPSNKYETPAAVLVDEAGPDVEPAEDGDLVAVVLSAIEEPVAPKATLTAEDETPEPEYGAWLIADLRDECAKRGLLKSGNKDELVARLFADDDAKVG